MKRLYPVLLFVLIISLSFCGKQAPTERLEVEQEIIKIDEEKEADLRFSLIEKIQVPDISYPIMAFSKEQARLYIYGEYLKEPQKFVVKVYSSRLEFLFQKVFHRGQGPGDVSPSNVITPIGDKIYLVENANSRISIFNNEFEFIEIIKYPWERVGGPFDLMNKGQCFIGTGGKVLGKDYVVSYTFVTFPDLKETLISKKSMTLPVPKKWLFYIDTKPHHSCFWKGQHLYFLYMNDYQLLKIDEKGKKMKDVIVKVDKIENPEDKIAYYLKEQGQFNINRFKKTLSDTVMPTSSLVSLGKGFVVVRRKDYSYECSGLVEGDYFNYDFQFLGKVQIPCYYRIYALLGTKFIKSYHYHEGFFYLLNEIDENLWLEKWQVIE